MYCLVLPESRWGDIDNDFDRIIRLGILSPTHTGLSATPAGLPQKFSVQSVAGSQIRDRRSSRTLLKE